MKRTVLFLMGGICMALFSACTAMPGKETAASVQETEISAAAAEETETEPAELSIGRERSLKSGEISRIVFDYDLPDQYSLHAEVTDLSGSDAAAEIRKTVGIVNYDGIRKEETLKLDPAQAEELRKILGSYDIEGMSRLHDGGSGVPARSLTVLAGDQKYEVPSGTEFPVTLPPVEDLMYSELFNFFNDRISGEPGWENVRSADLGDPGQNPAYGERRAIQFGNLVRLVPGTGVKDASGKGAVIDYGIKNWWQEEGFTGTWTITEADRQEQAYLTADEAVLTVDDAGNVKLVLDGREWTGLLGPFRYYRREIRIPLTRRAETRLFTIENIQADSYRELLITSSSGSAVQPDYPETYLRVSDPARQKGREPAQDTMAQSAETEPPRVFTAGKETWPADGHLPTLEEVRAKEEAHGPLTEVLWSRSHSGMQAGDLSRSFLRLYRENGEGRLAHGEMLSFQPETIHVYFVRDEVFEKLQAIVDRENLAAWAFLQKAPDRRMYLYDVSETTEVTLTFNDVSSGAGSLELRTIDREAAEGQGGEAVLDEVYKLLRSCVRSVYLLETGEVPNPYASGVVSQDPDSAEFETAADGTWTCPVCGISGTTGKFCPGCGSKRPE